MAKILTKIKNTYWIKNVCMAKILTKTKILTISNSKEKAATPFLETGIYLETRHSF